MEINILGTGCKKCRAMEEVAREAVSLEGINANVSKVEDMMEIMKYGVLATPALVINEKVVLSGRVPSLDEVKKLLKV